MREVTIRIHCDKCYAGLNEEDVNEVKLTIGSLSYEGDACNSCLSEWTSPMRMVKKKKPPAKAGTSGPYACTHCDKRFSKRGGLTRHLNETHGVK